MLAHGFRVGTASGIIFSSLFASGKLTTPLQLHVGLQFPGGLAAGLNTLPRVTPLQWANWGNYMGRNWESLSLIALAPYRSRRGQLCALAMCCHLFSAMMPDHALGISVFSLFTVNWFCVQLHYLCTLIARPTVQLFKASYWYILYCALYSQ